MRILTKILLVLLLLFVIAQFFQPEKNNGDMVSLNAFEDYTNPPEDVKLILETSCYDCHSAHTRYPWYGSITPVNYWIKDHIEEGKEHFNMSKWDDYSIAKKDHKFEELIKMVEVKEMPLDSYTWTHGDANLSDEQIQSIIAWAEKVRIKLSLESKPQ